eukprot:jgi/Botrbrau1/5409/Bobra.182_1s0013.1
MEVQILVVRSFSYHTRVFLLHPPPLSLDVTAKREAHANNYTTHRTHLAEVRSCHVLSAGTSLASPAQCQTPVLSCLVQPCPSNNVKSVPSIHKFARPVQ